MRYKLFTILAVVAFMSALSASAQKTSPVDYAPTDVGTPIYCQPAGVPFEALCPPERFVSFSYRPTNTVQRYVYTFNASGGGRVTAVVAHAAQSVIVPYDALTRPFTLTVVRYTSPAETVYVSLDVYRDCNGGLFTITDLCITPEF